MPICLTGAGSPGNFVPVAPSGANYAYLCYPTYWASDASHLVQCNAGDAIQWWKDAVTGTWYQQATSGSRLIARFNSSSGRWYAEGTGSQQHPWVDLSSYSAANVTFAASYQLYSGINYATLISSQSIRNIGFQSGAQNTYPRATFSSGASVNSPNGNTIGVDYRLIATFGNPNTSLYQNGTLAATSSADTTTGNLAVNTSVMGLYSTSVYCINGRFYGGAIFLSNSVNVSSLDATLHGYCTS